MSRSIHRRAHRTGLVSADIFRPGVDDLTQLAALAPNDIWDGTLIHVRDLNGIYAYDLESVAVDDGLTVITPATAVGRWLQIGFGGTSSATSGTADKWIDVTKITASETITVDVSLASDWPQEVRRDTIDVDGVLDVVDGYVLSGDYPLEISGQTEGDTLYFDGSSWVRLAAGTTGKVLQTNGPGAYPSWESRSPRIDTHRVDLGDPTPTAVKTYNGWTNSDNTVLTKVRVICSTQNTVGTLELDIKDSTTASVLSGVVDMNTLTANTVLNVPLTGTASLLQFSDLETWSIDLTASGASDAEGVRVELQFEVSA